MPLTMLPMFTFTSYRFTNIWTEFCRNPEASLIRGKPAADTLTDLILMDHQETLKRERHAGIKVVDEVVTEMREAASRKTQGEEKTKKPTLLQEKNDAARARLLPPGSKERLLSVPIDKYLKAEVQVNFRESGKNRVKKGSFAYANQSMLEGKCIRSLAALRKTEEADDEEPDVPFSSTTRRKLGVATLLADGDPRAPLLTLPWAMHPDAQQRVARAPPRADGGGAGNGAAAGSAGAPAKG